MGPKTCKGYSINSEILRGAKWKKKICGKGGRPKKYAGGGSQENAGGVGKKKKYMGQQKKLCWGGSSKKLTICEGVREIFHSAPIKWNSPKRKKI